MAEASRLPAQMASQYLWPRCGGSRPATISLLPGECSTLAPKAPRSCRAEGLNSVPFSTACGSCQHRTALCQVAHMHMPALHRSLQGSGNCNRLCHTANPSVDTRSTSTQPRRPRTIAAMHVHVHGQVLTLQTLRKLLTMQGALAASRARREAHQP